MSTDAERNKRHSFEVGGQPPNPELVDLLNAERVDRPPQRIPYSSVVGCGFMVDGRLAIIIPPQATKEATEALADQVERGFSAEAQLRAAQEQHQGALLNYEDALREGREHLRQLESSLAAATAENESYHNQRGQLQEQCERLRSERDGHETRFLNLVSIFHGALHPGDEHDCTNLWCKIATRIRAGNYKPSTIRRPEVEELREQLAAANARVEELTRTKEQFRTMYESSAKFLADTMKERDEARQRLAELGQILESERTMLFAGVTAIKKAISARDWLTEGRGAYEYDDDRWQDEFKYAIEEIHEALKPLAERARDWSNCPQTHAEVIDARIDLKKRLAEVERERDQRNIEIFAALREKEAFSAEVQRLLLANEGLKADNAALRNATTEGDEDRNA